MQPPGGGAPLCSSRRPAGIIVPNISTGNAWNKLEHILIWQRNIACVKLCSSARPQAACSSRGCPGVAGPPIPPSLKLHTPLAGALVGQGPCVNCVTLSQLARHSFSYCVPLAHTGAKLSMQAQPPPGTAGLGAAGLGATGLDGACSLRPGASAERRQSCTLISRHAVWRKLVQVSSQLGTTQRLHITTVD